MRICEPLFWTPKRVIFSQHESTHCQCIINKCPSLSQLSTTDNVWYLKPTLRKKVEPTWLHLWNCFMVCKGPFNKKGNSWQRGGGGGGRGHGHTFDRFWKTLKFNLNITVIWSTDDEKEVVSSLFFFDRLCVMIQRLPEVSFYAFLGGGLEKFAMSFLFWETLNLLNGP